MATLPQGNHQPGAINGHKQSWKTPGELEVSKSMEYVSALTSLVGRQEGHLACKKKLDVGLLVVMI